VTTADGFVARVFQHEVDHLDGIRFPDRIDNDAHLHWVEPHEIATYAKAAPHWPRLCPRERWLGMKAGTAHHDGTEGRT
jgi:peptide deformylase